MIDWIESKNEAPKEDVIILASNGNYCELVYIENGRCNKPWRYDKHDTPTFYNTSGIKYWCEVNMIGGEEEES